MKYSEVTNPIISWIIPVYNKAQYLPYVINAVINQEYCPACEYIFVDDSSSDDSINVIRQQTKNIANVKIIANSDNKGPAVRINQAGKIASGKYIRIIDADDIVPKNSNKIMFDILEKENADFLYGKFQKTSLHAKQLVGKSIDENPPYEIIHRPLEYILANRGFVRMTCMIKTEIFKKAGGCDESVFIQDESLPLRLAQCSQILVELKTPVIFVPNLAEELSKNKNQQHHDKFLACYNMLEKYPDLNEKETTLIHSKLAAAAFKNMKSNLKLNSCSFLLAKISLTYLKTKIFRKKLTKSEIELLRKFFYNMKNVRRS